MVTQLYLARGAVGNPLRAVGINVALNGRNGSTRFNLE